MTIVTIVTKESYRDNRESGACATGSRLEGASGVVTSAVPDPFEPLRERGISRVGGARIHPVLRRRVTHGTTVWNDDPATQPEDVLTVFDRAIAMLPQLVERYEP